MSWFLSLFSSNNQKDRRGQAITSTHEAFSLPSTSILPQRADSFTAEPFDVSGADPSHDSSYTYPPKGGSGARYGYLPTSGGLRSRPSSLLPLHRDSMATLMSDQAPYPPLEQTWNRLRAWLNREYPELGDTLNWGILPQDLTQIELQFGFLLPPAVRDSYLMVDGQEAESAAGCNDGLFFGLTLMPLEDVLEEWKFWREVDGDPATGANENLREAMESIPPNWIRLEYSQRGWIPLIADKAGNYVGVDLNPGESGSVGQVIVFGRDFDTKVVLWKGDGEAGWANWLATFVDELESGEGFEIGNQDSSEGSEDDLGFESYFYDGNGRGQGDGGGDTGQGGIRLTGDYKGWNVFEAWADRSLRKWYEAGAIPENVTAQEKGKNVENVGLGVMEFSNDIPAEVVDQAVTHARSRQSSLPTISVTKAPAPLPVALPSPREISTLPSPPDSPDSFEMDLESGRSKGMRRGASDIPYIARKSKSKPSNTELPQTVDLEAGPPTPQSTTPLINKTLSLPSSFPDNDLLVEAEPVPNTADVLRSSPNVAEEEEASDSLVDLKDPREEDEEGSVELNTTIRLVSGGGGSEVPLPQVEEDGGDDEDDASSVNSAMSNIDSVPSPDGKKRHKAGLSSLSSFKKLGLGGKRKKGYEGGKVTLYD